MINFKRILLVILGCLLIITLIGCGETRPASKYKFFDDFSDPASGWLGHGTYQNGELEIQLTTVANGFTSSVAPCQVPADYSIQAEMRLASGSVVEAGYGLYIDSRNNVYCCFRVRPDTQQYQVFKLTDGSVWENLINWTNSSYINASSTNILKVIKNGNQAALYINGNLVNTITIDFISDPLVGLHASSFGNLPVITRFDNFQLVEQ
jgi:hypothetical protein